MMKKLLLLTASGLFAAGAFAQQNANQSVVLKVDRQPVTHKVTDAPVKSQNAISRKSSSAQKTTLGGGRWYEPYAIADEYLGGGRLNNNRFVSAVAYDSTYLQMYLDGPGPALFLGWGQYFDPFAEGFNTNDGGQDYFGDEDIKITRGNAYTVDSIYFFGAYVESNNPAAPVKGSGMIDTFIISLTPTPEAVSSYRIKDYPAAANYDRVKDRDSTVRIQNVPSVNINSRGFTTAAARTWKFPIPDSLRQKQTASGFTTMQWKFAVDTSGGKGVLNVPAGQGVTMAVTFKPGEPKVSGRDSINDYHHFMPLYASGEDNGWSPYFFYSFNDRNMTYLMHRRGGGSLSSAVGLEIVNNNQNVDWEFQFNGAYLSCATCSPLGLSETKNKNIKSVKAYPNPANAEVHVPFVLNSQSDVTISLTNTIGQIVKVESFKATLSGEAIFTTSDLANGVYIYTVEANGQRETGRIAIRK